MDSVFGVYRARRLLIPVAKVESDFPIGKTKKSDSPIGCEKSSGDAYKHRERKKTKKNPMEFPEELNRTFQSEKD